MRYIKLIKWGWHCGVGYICKVLLYLAYHISLFTPRSKNIWVFGSWQGGKFADNSKYLFLYVQREHPEIRPIWITLYASIAKKLNREGYEAYTTFSIKGWFYSMRASCAIISCSLSDVNLFAIGGAKKINVSHGTVLKQGGYKDKIHAKETRQKQKMSRLDKVRTCLERKLLPPVYYDILTISSETVHDEISESYRVERNQVHITGLPRNDALLGATYLDSVRCDYLENIRSRVQFREVYSYMPTFRDGVRHGLDLFERYHFDVEEVQRFLERRNAILIIKGHLADKRMNLLGTIAETDRIYYPTEDELPDTQPLLNETDILITDYSGVYFDYLLLNRPIIFAPFDFEQYTRESRELAFDYDEVTPGPKAKNWREVFHFVEEELREDHWKQEREAVCRRFQEFRDGGSSARVFKLVRGG